MTAGKIEPVGWLGIDVLLSHFAKNQRTAAREYIRYVQTNADQVKGGVWKHLTHQICLGDETFVAAFRKERILDSASETGEISLPQRKVLQRTLREFRSDYLGRDEAMARAYRSGAFTMKEIGVFFGVHYMTVSRAVKKFEASNVGDMQECY